MSQKKFIWTWEPHKQFFNQILQINIIPKNLEGSLYFIILKTWDPLNKYCPKPNFLLVPEF